MAALQASASAPAVEASLPAVLASLPSVLAQPSEDVDMDVIVGASIGDACILPCIFPNFMAALLASASAPAVEASLPAVPPSLPPSVLAQPNENVDMDVIVGASIGDACILPKLMAASQTEDSDGVAAKSQYQADTTVRLALLQAGAIDDGIQSQVSSVMT
jgi:hypothetical protein